MEKTGSATLFATCLALLLIAAETGAQFNSCPDPESLLPCTCDFTGINCMKAKSAEQLAKAFSGREKTVHRALWVQNLPVTGIPVNVFGEYAFGKVFIEINTELATFPLSALANSSQFLTELSLYGNRLRGIDSNWLPNFQRLRVLNMANNNVQEIPSYAFRSVSIQTLVLNGNPIKTIGAFAFESLPKLKSLRLRGIQVKTLGANALTIPLHHPQLEILLDGGLLENIEEKAFDGTAPLTLQLNKNSLTDLSGPVFKPLMTAMASNARRNNLIGESRIITAGNSFSCRGCEFSWLSSLAGKPEMLLMLLDFRCKDGTRVWNVTSSVTGCS